MDCGTSQTESTERCLFLEDCCKSSGYFIIFAESFRSNYEKIRGQLSCLAEAVARPPLLHEYHLTPFSLGAAVSNGISETDAIVFFLRNCYGIWDSEGQETELCISLKAFLHFCISRYNLARVVIDGDNTIVMCKYKTVATELQADSIIQSLLMSEVIKEKICLWDGEESSYFILEAKGRAVSKLLCERCVVLGYPLWQQYDYENDTLLRKTCITLNSQTRPRAYQVEAVEAATKENVLNSGCLLLPCGAGKTLVGIMLICKVRKPTLIVCAGSVSVDQWKNQIMEYATLDLPPDQLLSTPRKNPIRGGDRIACITGKQKDDITDDTDIVLTTYSMLVSAFKSESRKLSAKYRNNDDVSFTRKRRSNPKEKLFSSYGLLLLDEVHVIPADAFRESLSFVDAKAAIGLTATYVREDKKILDLFHLVGPKLYDISMESLVSKGYLAKVQCVEIHTPMTKEFGLEYLDQSIRNNNSMQAGRVSIQVLLAASNPNKMYCVRDLVLKHLEAGAKILVFCDHIVLLEEYGKILGAPVVCGNTQIKERLMIFSDFQTTNKLNVVCISRVGDVSVNLPSANVVIQVSSHGGSRRQEAQRLGRILRPKDKSSSSSTAIQAWFYSIVSTDTLEMAYAAHRTAFLVDLGYSTRIMEYSLSTGKNSEFPASEIKTLVVGDAQSVKHEELASSIFASRRLQCFEDLESSQSFLSQQYQIKLLAKVVSRWEMEYQGLRREQKSLSSKLESAHEDVEIIETFAETRDFSLIKNEANLTNDFQISAQLGANLRNSVGVDDDFIYHEL